MVTREHSSFVEATQACGHEKFEDVSSKSLTCFDTLKIDEILGHHFGLQRKVYVTTPPKLSRQRPYRVESREPLAI